MDKAGAWAGDRSAPKRKYNYGGQAVLEGVMMRGPEAYAIALRLPDGTIHVRRDERPPLAKGWPVLGWPFIRGIASLIDSLTIGIESLVYSANQLAEAEGEEIGKGEMSLSVIAAFVVAIGLFVIAPTYAIGLLKLPRHSWLYNLVEGALRLAIFLGYVYAIARMKDIQRVLAFHGAEHKAINAFEAGAPLAVDEVRPFPTLHPRCGTSFLLFVALVSIVLFSFFGWPSLAERILLRLALLPVVAGIAYELIRAAGNAAGRSYAPVLAWVSWPGLALQRLTTREPDDGQVECAIAALKAVLMPEDLADSDEKDTGVTSNVR